MLSSRDIASPFATDSPELQVLDVASSLVPDTRSAGFDASRLVSDFDSRNRENALAVVVRQRLQPAHSAKKPEPSNPNGADRV